MTFRWYGDQDPITLSQIAQIPKMSGIVSAVYDIKVGEIWSDDSIMRLKKQAEQHSLSFEVVESVPVHEEIKLGTKNASQYIKNYCENIKKLSHAGVKVICYNFMPVFDWLRSELAKPMPDGSNSLAYDHQTVLKMNPLQGDLSLPGWDQSYKQEELSQLLKQYQSITEEDLWNNLTAFLQEVIPTASKYGVYLGIHPDDPPWGLFGLPRIITNEANLERFLHIVDSPYNGITFCTGSLGANPSNDLIHMIHRFQGRIPFVHLRNIIYQGELSFQETAHPTDCGSLDIYGILRALYETGFDGYIRPDHGRMIWGEQGRYGYGLYDRALGASYINGVWECLEKTLRS